MVTRNGKNMTLKEVVDGIFSRQESEAKERERREREKEEIGKKCKEYYETHMKKEMERLNTLVDWYKFKLNPIAYGGRGEIFIPHHHSISCHSETT